MKASRTSPQLENILSRFGWLIVIGANLTLSTWSLYWIARQYGVPVTVAPIISACFDGSALLCADYALRYARTSDSGAGPRIGVFACAAISSYLNSQHAALAHNPPAARILWGAPPIIAVVIFEFHNRWERRAALRKAGRLPQALPAFGRWAWVLFPFKTLGTVRDIVRYRIDAVRTRNVTAEIPEPSPQNGYPVAVIRDWARTRGMNVSDRGRLPEDIKAAFHAAAITDHDNREGSRDSDTPHNGYRLTKITP